MEFGQNLGMFKVAWNAMFDAVATSRVDFVALSQAGEVSDETGDICSDPPLTRHAP
jgi:hypothetical protein